MEVMEVINSPKAETDFDTRTSVFQDTDPSTKQPQMEEILSEQAEVVNKNLQDTLKEFHQEEDNFQELETIIQTAIISVEEKMEDLCGLFKRLQENSQSECDESVVIQEMVTSSEQKYSEYSSCDNGLPNQLQDLDSESSELSLNNQNECFSSQPPTLTSSNTVSQPSSKNNDPLSVFPYLDISFPNISSPDLTFVNTSLSSSSLSFTSAPSFASSSSFESSVDSITNIDVSIPDDLRTYDTPYDHISSISPYPSSLVLSPSLIEQLDSSITSDRDIFVAARENNTQILRRLLDTGVDVNTRDKQQYTLLHCAVCRDNTSVVSLLLERGSDVNAKDMVGNTALHFAATCYYSQSIELLIDAGGDVNIKNNEGETPLHSAVKCNNEDAVRILLEAGAIKTDKDNFGRTPLDLAKEELSGIRVDDNANLSIRQMLAL